MDRQFISAFAGDSEAGRIPTKADDTVRGQRCKINESSTKQRLNTLTCERPKMDAPGVSIGRPVRSNVASKRPDHPRQPSVPC